MCAWTRYGLPDHLSGRGEDEYHNHGYLTSRLAANPLPGAHAVSLVFYFSLLLIAKRFAENKALRRAGRYYKGTPHVARQEKGVAQCGVPNGETDLVRVQSWHGLMICGCGNLLGGSAKEVLAISAVTRRFVTTVYLAQKLHRAPPQSLIDPETDVRYDGAATLYSQYPWASAPQCIGTGITCYDFKVRRAAYKHPSPGRKGTLFMSYDDSHPDGMKGRVQPSCSLPRNNEWSARRQR
ncbi:hypothetical protein BC827DRAFT_1156078 [Russula dissimulans]|nr:hypothetical protein BC827DRAFT_1156078 [Russula dissimulans]